MNSSDIDQHYIALLQHLLKHGLRREDRTGTGTLSRFGVLYRHNLKAGFPLLTTKKVHFKSVAEELLWFLRGDSNVRSLQERGVSIWDEWADEAGDLGPVYGKQWRFWKGEDGKTHDQIATLLDGLKNRPFSRRHILSAWNVADLPNEKDSPQTNVAQGKMALAPCHVMYQFYVHDNELSCMMTQRSADVFLGLPFNIASTALLTHILAEEVGLTPGEVIHSIGDLHLYLNHVDSAQEQIKRDARQAPTLYIKPRADRTLENYTLDDFVLTGYDPHPAIKAKVAV
ncbi:MAG: thymidylate synthase [Pseudomonadota bacterium]